MDNCNSIDRAAGFYSTNPRKEGTGGYIERRPNMQIRLVAPMKTKVYETLGPLEKDLATYSRVIIVGPEDSIVFAPEAGC